jgi:hypothetical protein
MYLRPSRLLAVTLLALCAACSGKKEGAGANNADKPVSAAADEASGGGVNTEGQTADLGKLVDAVVASAAELPHEEFDPAALAKKLGKDPQAHFEWVRDHTWWVPYRGLLRGSQGVLLDRVGSNLDRAVLLGELLRQSGDRVRLAHAELSETQARDLIDKLRPIPSQRNERQRGSGGRNSGLDASLQQQFAETNALREKAGALVDSQATQLYSVLKGSAGGTDGHDRQTAISAMRDYWWVEREENGRWIGMDVLAPAGKGGSIVSKSSTTEVWVTDDPIPGIPDADLHSVKIRLVIERYADGATSESTVLETELRPAELFERPVTLTHLPKPWPTTVPASTEDPNAVGNAAVNVKEWVPVLQVGREFIAQSGFTDGGDLIAEPLDAKRDIAATGGGGFMSGFAEALGGGETPSSSLTAEWLDYEIHVPGEQTQHLRRPVFDLLGAAKRSAKSADFDANTNERLIERYEALLASTQILLQASDFTGDFLAHLETKSIAANQAAFRELSNEQDAVKASKLAFDLLDRLDVWGPLPILALWRSELGGSSRPTFIDRTNVLSYRVGMAAVNADRVAFREQIDVAANSTGITVGAASNSFEIRLRQGVADTVAEILALGGNFQMTDNTASLFAMGGTESNGRKVIGSRDEDAVHGLAWPEDASAILKGDINAGYMAVVLNDPIAVDDRQRVAWWRVDPASGETIGVMDTGFHGGMDERVETELEIVQLRNALRNWLKDRAKDIAAAKQRASVPWNAAEAGDAELLADAKTVMDALRLAAEAGF